MTPSRPYSYSWPQPPPPALTPTLLPPTPPTPWKICHLSVGWVLHFPGTESSHTWGQRHRGICKLVIKIEILLHRLVFIGIYLYSQDYKRNPVSGFKPSVCSVCRLTERQFGFQLCTLPKTRKGNKDVQYVPSQKFCGLCSQWGIKNNRNKRCMISTTD